VAAALPVAFLAAWLLGMPQLDPESPLASVRNPFAIPGLAGVGMVVAGVASPAIALTMVVAAASLVRRFRRGRGSERQQLRWLALAAALAPLVVLVTAAAILIGQLAVAGWIIGLYLALLPLAIAAAIARYRLYDLDRIVSRTLAYGLLTLLLGWRLRGGGAGAGPVAGPGLQPGRGRGDPGGGRAVPAGPPPHPGCGGSAIQPAPLRRRPHHRGVQRPAAPAG
jgi:hypothetical protein